RLGSRYGVARTSKLALSRREAGLVASRDALALGGAGSLAHGRHAPREAALGRDGALKGAVDRLERCQATLVFFSAAASARARSSVRPTPQQCRNTIRG